LEKILTEGVIGEYAIGGATAAGFHGEPLATRDIDVFCFLNVPEGSFLVSLEPVFKKLSKLGFSEFDEEGIIIHGMPVQFLAASNELEIEAINNADILHWDGHTIRVMKPEYLADIALTVGRPKDRARVVYLCELQDFLLQGTTNHTNTHENLTTTVGPKGEGVGTTARMGADM